MLLKILEIVLIVLILRALLSVITQMVRARKGGRTPVQRYKEERFDTKKMDIEDGEFKELK